MNLRQIQSFLRLSFFYRNDSWPPPYTLKLHYVVRTLRKINLPKNAKLNLNPREFWHEPWASAEFFRERVVNTICSTNIPVEAILLYCRRFQFVWQICFQFRIFLPTQCIVHFYLEQNLGLAWLAWKMHALTTSKSL